MHNAAMLIDSVLFLTILLVAGASDYHMNSEFEHSNTDYAIPNAHLRIENDDDEYFVKSRLIEHPYYQKSQNAPEYPHRLIDDDFFGMVPQIGLFF